MALQSKVALLLMMCLASAEAGELETIQTRYYTMYSDLPPEQTREAALRITQMAETYHTRTRDFSGVIKNRLPFYLFSREADYLAAGATKGTAGQYDGKSLFALAGDRATDRTWNTIQHEGFHQFADAVIGGKLPIWVNEGLAEYFGEGVWTGDDMVTGLVPTWRMKRIQQSIKDHKFKGIDTMLRLSHAQWNAEMKIENYDQAWSMVQFLAHGDGGKYQAGFSQFMLALSRGQDWSKAFTDAFGGTNGFERAWANYWLHMESHPTAEQQAEVVVRTLASILGRAASQGQTFDSLDELAAASEVKTSDDDWLPPSLLTTTFLRRDAIENALPYRFSLETKGKSQQVVCKLDDKRAMTGTWKLRGRRMGEVMVKTSK